MQGQGTRQTRMQLETGPMNRSLRRISDELQLRRFLPPSADEPCTSPRVSGYESAKHCTFRYTELHGKGADAGIIIRPANVLGVSCAARAHVPKPERRGGCRQRRSTNRMAGLLGPTMAA